jgi:hypothetical protein
LKAAAVESVSLEAAAVKTTAVDVDVAKPPHRTQEAIAKNAVVVKADAIKSANADATAATVVEATVLRGCFRGCRSWSRYVGGRCRESLCHEGSYWRLLP